VTPASARRLLLAALAAAALVVLAPGAARGTTPAELDYACSPAPADCEAWYRSAVTVTWDWRQHDYEAAGGDCSARLFTVDTPGTWAQCAVKPIGLASPVFAEQVLVRVDRTPPRVVAALPDRPPDHGGWFNHPIGFGFRGADATSGVAACSRATYRGPDGAPARVLGTCWDRAGNSASGSFPVDYDATPPAPPRVQFLPGNRVASLRWRPPRDATLAEVVRSPAGGRGRAVYAGGRRSFRDRRLRNGTRYRYTIFVVDRAGNRAKRTVELVPTRGRLLNPWRNAHVRRPPLLLWKPVSRARYYNVQLRRGRKVLSSWPTTPRLQLRRRWTFRGHRYRLRPGRYVWYLWAGYGPRSAARYGHLLGKRAFRVVS
jgi:hypothetical protein